MKTIYGILGMILFGISLPFQLLGIIWHAIAEGFEYGRDVADVIFDKALPDKE